MNDISASAKGRTVRTANPHHDLGSAATLWLFNGKSVSENDLQHFAAWLGPSETSRLACFTRTVRRRQFLLGRVLLRFAVANITGLASDEFSVLEKCGEGPQLSFHDRSYPAPNFSLSHSGDWVACVVSTAAVLGVDIEVNRVDRDFDALCSFAFQAREQVWLGTRPHSERSAAFYLLWCMREALYKLQCNLGLDSDVSALVGKENSDNSLPGIYPYQVPAGDLGLTAVVLTSRRLSVIRQILLTGFGTADV
jgi:4'-phosphopantetheinyl transferase